MRLIKCKPSVLFGGALALCVTSAAQAGCPGTAAVVGLFAGCGVVAQAPLRVDASDLLDTLDVPASKLASHALHVDARAAHRLRQQTDSVVLIDIRSRDEVSFAGWPLGADGNVPYMEPALPLHWNTQRGALDMAAVPAFGERVQALIAALGRERVDLVILLCQTGDRSARAADELIRYGYVRVATVIDGFEGDLGTDGRRSVNGWKNAGLPWQHRVPADALVGVDF